MISRRNFLMGTAAIPVVGLTIAEPVYYFGWDDIQREWRNKYGGTPNHRYLYSDEHMAWLDLWTGELSDLAWGGHPLAVAS